jgi:MarR family transcriptional regulator, organic hydroperoxide resistance regulator
MSDDRLPRGDNVLLQMFRTSQATRALVMQATEGSGITPDEYAVLSAVGVLRSTTPTELAVRLGVPPTTISRYVASFVERGLLERAPNPADRRSYFLEVTENGRAVIRKVVPRFRKIVEELRERVDVDEIDARLVELEHAARAMVDVPTTR